MYAAENGHLEVVKILIQPEAKMFDIEGKTAMFHAAVAGKKECVDELAKLEKGLVNGKGNTMLWEAA